MKKTIVVISRPGSQWNPRLPVRQQPYWDDHARFIDALFEDGTILMGGPFLPDGSGSMLILSAESVEAARAVLRQDPWALRDVLLASEVREWSIFLDARDRAKG